SQIATQRQRHFIVGPKLPPATERVSANAKTRMIINQSELGPVGWSQQIILIYQFESGVQKILVQKTEGRLERVSVQIVHLTRIARMIATPNKGRCPVASLERLVVLH